MNQRADLLRTLTALLLTVFSDWASQTLWAATVSPPFPVASVNVTPGPGSQVSPAFAWSGDVGLAVWFENFGDRIRGAIISSDGVPVNPSNNAILANRSSFSALDMPSVGSNGADFLVAWKTGPQVFALKVNQQGAFASPFEISAIQSVPRFIGAFNDATAPSIAAMGSSYLIVWTASISEPNGTDGFVSYNQIYGAIVENGAVLKRFPISLASAVQPSVASNGSLYVVAYMHGGVVKATRVSSDGAVLDTTPLTVSSSNYQNPSPRISAVGNTFLAVWEDARNGNYDIYGARLETTPSALTLTDPNGIPIATGSGVQSSPSIASNGQDFLVGWSDGADLAPRAARVNPTSAVVTPSFGISVDTRPAGGLSLAAKGSTYCAIWHQGYLGGFGGRAFSEDIYFATIPPSGPLQPFRVTTSLGKFWPAVAFNGVDYLAVWEDSRHEELTGRVAIYGTRISASGQIRDPGGILISDVGYCTAPDVALVGQDFVCVWKSAEDGLSRVVAARISAAGVVKDSPAIGLASAGVTGNRIPVIAAHGDKALVAFTQSLRIVTGVPLQNKPEGLVPSSARDLSTSQSVTYAVNITANDQGFLVVWEEGNVQQEHNIFAALASPSGDPSNNRIRICNVSKNQAAPTVAANNSGFLIAWEDYRTTDSGQGIYAAKVSTSGVVAPANGQSVALSISPLTAPKLSSDGEEFLLVHQSQSIENTISLDASRLTATGGVISTFTLADNLPPQRQLAIQYESANNKFIAIAEHFPPFQTLAAWFIDNGPRAPGLRPPTIAGNLVTLTWAGATDSLYQIEYKDALTSGLWSQLGPEIKATGQFQTQTQELPVSPLTGFYRLRQIVE